MATDLRCPNCEEYLGKDVENDITVMCGNCGIKFYNEYGYNEEEDERESGMYDLDGNER